MKRHLDVEEVLDGIWVAFSLWYVLTAQEYPGAARFVPTVVGGVTLIVAVIQLLGHFIGGLASITKGQDALGAVGAATGAPVAEPWAPEGGGVPAGARSKQVMTPTPSPDTDRRQLTAILWGIGLLAGLYLFGYAVTVPLFMVAYFIFAYRTPLVYALGSAVVMGVLTTVLFSDVLGVSFPQGLLLRLLGG